MYSIYVAHIIFHMVCSIETYVVTLNDPILDLMNFVNIERQHTLRVAAATTCQRHNSHSITCNFSWPCLRQQPLTNHSVGKAPRLEITVLLRHDVSISEVLLGIFIFGVGKPIGEPPHLLVLHCNWPHMCWASASWWNDGKTVVQGDNLITSGLCVNEREWELSAASLAACGSWSGSPVAAKRCCCHYLSR